MMDIAHELRTLNDELDDARGRLSRADPEGVIELKRQIREIERDIRRYSERIGMS